MLRYAVLAIALVSCSDDSTTQEECDRIADEIRDAALRRNLEPRGVCNLKTPDVEAAFKNACDSLRDCNARVR